MTPDNLPGIIYDGCQLLGTRFVLCFTDLVTGASFALDPAEAEPSRVIAAALCKRREMQREGFEG